MGGYISAEDSSSSGSITGYFASNSSIIDAQKSYAINSRNSGFVSMSNSSLYAVSSTSINNVEAGYRSQRNAILIAKTTTASGNEIDYQEVHGGKIYFTSW